MKSGEATLKRQTGIGAETAKGIVVITVPALCLISLIFCNLVSKNQLDIGFSIPYKGFELFQLLFNGGAYTMYDPWGNVVTVKYPMFMCIAAMAGIILLVLLLAFLVLRYTLWKEKARVSHIASFACMTAGGIFIVEYIALLFCSVSVHDYYDNSVSFYSIFEIKSVVLIVGLALVLDGVIEYKLGVKSARLIKKFLPIYGFMAIPLVLICTFNLYPVWLQTILSFKDFNLKDGVWGSKWVGLYQFKTIFTDTLMLQVIGRTIYISVLRLIVGIIPPLILSVCLYDLKSSKMRSVFQNIVYIPHFFSWVVVYAITYSLLSPEGLMNSVFGTSVDYMVSKKYFLTIVIVTSIWKELGWGTILYLAALSGVDTSLFEAAKIDGAKPLQRVVHITLPSIRNTIVFLTVMSLGNILKGAGGEQLLLFYSATTKDQALVIDTWLVWYGMKELQYSLGAAMSFFQSAIGMIMVLGCNYISKKTCEVSMW